MSIFVAAALTNSGYLVMSENYIHMVIITSIYHLCRGLRAGHCSTPHHCPKYTQKPIRRNSTQVRVYNLENRLLLHRPLCKSRELLSVCPLTNMADDFHSASLRDPLEVSKTEMRLQAQRRRQILNIIESRGKMDYVFMALTGIHLIASGLALYYDEKKSAAWFFLAACFFAIGMFF